MASINYLNPSAMMSLTDQKEYRMRAVAAGIARAFSKSIGSMSDVPTVVPGGNERANAAKILAHLKAGNAVPSVDVREFQPILDAGTALDQWNTAALAVVGNAYSCFQAVAAPALAANKIAIFYKVGVETVPMPVSRLIFRVAAAAGNIQAEFDLEQIANQLETIGFFSEPVVFDNSQAFAAQVLCRIATGVLARVQLGGLIVEPTGQTIA